MGRVAIVAISKIANLRPRALTALALAGIHTTRPRRGRLLLWRCVVGDGSNPDAGSANWNRCADRLRVASGSFASADERIFITIWSISLDAFAASELPQAGGLVKTDANQR